MLRQAEIAKAEKAKQAEEEKEQSINVVKISDE